MGCAQRLFDRLALGPFTRRLSPVDLVSSFAVEDEVPWQPARVRFVDEAVIEDELRNENAPKNWPRGGMEAAEGLDKRVEVCSREFATSMGFFEVSERPHARAARVGFRLFDEAANRGVEDPHRNALLDVDSWHLRPARICVGVVFELGLLTGKIEIIGEGPREALAEQVAPCNRSIQPQVDKCQLTSK